MRKIHAKKLMSLALAVALVFTMALATSSTAEAAAKKTITLNKSKVTVYVGKTTTLKVTKSTGLSGSKSVTWSTSNSKVATVSTKGVVKGIKKGTATIKATSKKSKKVTKTCKVTVAQQVTSLIATTPTLTIKKGAKATIKTTVGPSNASNKGLTYTTSKKSVATVSSKGVVSAKKAGTATITIKSKDGFKKATVKVTVKNSVTKVSSVRLNASAKTLWVGGKVKLTATVSPSKATVKTVYWKSLDTKVATVDQKGNVTAKAKGTTYITATATDGTYKSAKCKITVVKHVTSVKLSKTSLSFTTTAAQKLTATVSPSDAYNKGVTWTTSDAKIATVSQSGVVTPKANGTATITVTTKDGSKKATCKVTVAYAVTSVSANVAGNASVTLTEAGQKAQIVATVAPANAANQTLTYASSNNAVATVSATGTITAVANGTANITVKTNNGKTATIAVTVAIAPKNAFETTDTAYAATFDAAATSYDITVDGKTRNVKKSDIDDTFNKVVTKRSTLTPDTFWGKVNADTAKKYVDMLGITTSSVEAVSTTDTVKVFKVTSSYLKEDLYVTATRTGADSMTFAVAKKNAEARYTVTVSNLTVVNSDSTKTEISASVALAGSASTDNYAITATITDTTVVVNVNGSKFAEMTKTEAGYTVNFSKASADKAYSKLMANAGDETTLPATLAKYLEGASIYAK